MYTCKEWDVLFSLVKWRYILYQFQHISFNRLYLEAEQREEEHKNV